MKKSLLMKTMLLLFALIVGSSAWADTATITFASQTSGTTDGSAAYTTSNFVSSGIANSSAAFGTITCSATTKCYSGKTGYGLKAGSSKDPGSFTIAFSTPLTNVTQITLNRASYSSTKDATITVKNGSTTLANAVSTPSSSAAFDDMDITSLSIESLAGLTVETSRYCYIKSITITYTSNPTCATPTFSPAAGTYTSAQNVTISTTTTGASIYYTKDGSTPTASSTPYTGAIAVSSTTTIKAIAVKEGNDDSDVATATYTIIEHAGTEADPYTVADAVAYIGTLGSETSATDVYVQGIISQIDSYNSSYHSITYWISDDGTTTGQMEVYSGKGLNGANFSGC